MSNDEHLVAIVSFEGAMKREMKRVRQQLQAAVDGGVSLNEFHLKVSCGGRVSSGEVKLEYSIAASDYGTDMVKGANLGEVVAEFLRRRGWSQVNAPKALAYDKIPSDDTEEKYDDRNGPETFDDSIV